MSTLYLLPPTNLGPVVTEHNRFVILTLLDIVFAYDPKVRYITSSPLLNGVTQHL